MLKWNTKEDEVRALKNALHKMTKRAIEAEAKLLRIERWVESYMNNYTLNNYTEGEKNNEQD